MIMREITSEEFHTFLKKYPLKSIYQTPEYGYIMTNQNNIAMFIGLIDNNSVIAASLILIEKIGNFKYAYAPRGFLIDYTDIQLLETFTKELKKFLGKKEIVAVKLSPMIVKNIYTKKGKTIKTNKNYDTIFENLKKLGYYHFGYNNFFESHKPRFDAILPLDKHYILLFKNIRKEFRTKIRSAEKKGIQIYRGAENELPYLYEQTKNKYPRNNQYFLDAYKFFDRNHKIDYYYAKLDTTKYLKLCQAAFEKQNEIAETINEEVLKNANKNSSKLISKKIDSDHLLASLKKDMIRAINLARDYPDGIIIASALIIRNQDEAVLFMDGFNPKFKTLNAKHLLLWKLIEKYAKLGFKTLHLGGVTNINIANKKYDGLNEFKLSFNANIIEYIGDLELITNNTLYFMYKKSNQLKHMIKK